MAAFNFPTGDAARIYQEVFTPLSSALHDIRESKKTYGSSPYIKLQTHSEENPKTLGIQPYLIHNNSYATLFQKAYAGTRHFTCNALSTWSWGYLNTWKCNRYMTATALKTAIAAFSLGLSELNELVLKDLNLSSLQELQEQLKSITQTLSDVRKTVFYIYTTYDQKIEENGEEKDALEGSGPEEIREQYTALTRLIKEEISSIAEKIDQNIKTLSSTPPSVESDLNCSSPASEKISVRDESRLIFKNQERASLWFIKQLKRRQKECLNSGSDAFCNFEAKKRNMEKKAPQDFIRFAKSLDEVFDKDDIRNYQAVNEVMERYTALLKNSGVDLSLSKPNNFRQLLKGLCLQNAPRKAYQILFQSLQNSEGTGPIGLDYEPALLNAIMNSGEYFPMFSDSE